MGTGTTTHDYKIKSRIMKTSIHLLIIFMLGLTPVSTIAMIDEFDFSGNVSETRYRDLSAQIRCLVCQNESLASSGAGLAQDLKREVYNLMDSGKNNEEVKDFLVQRYGNFILYKPPLGGSTFILWFAPFLLLILGGIIYLKVIKTKNSQSESPLTLEEQEKVRALLEEDEIQQDSKSGEAS